MKQANQCPFCGCDRNNGTDKQYHHTSDNVPNANWNRDDRQANLNRNGPGDADPSVGVRFSVKKMDY